MVKDVDSRYQKLFERVEKELGVEDLTPPKLRDFLGKSAFDKLSSGIKQSLLGAFIPQRSVVVIRGKRQVRYRDARGRFTKKPEDI